MNILVTGAKGFIGQNLTENLKNYRDGKNRTRPELVIDDIFEYDIDTDIDLLDDYCGRADFVFNLAGVNRPKSEEDFLKGNFGFAKDLLDMLKKHDNKCPVMLSSSIQAELKGRFEGSKYGESKLAGEELFFKYGDETGAKVLVYRFPNVFGKWCRPNYNSVVATFCNNIANGLEIRINDPDAELELVYIDDLVEEMMDALEGHEHRCDSEDGPDGHIRCIVPVTHKATVGGIAKQLYEFADMPNTLLMSEIPDGSFAKKLYSTYLSYLPPDKAIYDIPAAEDDRGSFAELIKSAGCGQISINISKPGKTKGEHWHNSKWEIFIVVAGHGLIQERRIGTDPSTGREYPIHEYEVSGDKIQAVMMLPGYTHNIINLSDTDDLVTVMWANEIFDADHPETYRDIVDKERK